MTQSKARISKVKFAADLELECLMLPDGSFGIGVSQIASVFSFLKNNATREVKALLGEDISLLKTTSELHSQSVNFITLQQFVSVCIQMLKRGNAVAERLLEIHAEASFTSIVSSAFGVKFTQEQMVEWVEARETHRLDFHPKLTAWLKLDDPNRTDYGHQVNLFKLTAGVYTEPVDGYSKSDLRKLTDAYTIYNAMRRKGMGHTEALGFI